MDIKEVTMVTILALLPTVMQGRKLERDAFPRATCTAPMATKGETAVVTCHYPLDVKQPGEIVAVSVELYPFTSSNTGSPRRDYVLECMWHQSNFTCTLDEEEHRVEGKEVVITIRNVAEDNQGRYLCKMMVKDGPNIHGDPCQLLLNGMNPAGPLPRTTDPTSTTDPAMDQPIIRDNDTGSGGGLVAGSVAAVVGVLVAVVTTVVFVCRKRRNAARQREKAQNGETKERHRLTEMENGGASGHDSTEGSLGSAEDPSNKTVQEKIEDIEENVRNETASSRPQFRPRTGELKRTEKETEIEENQQDAKKKEDEEKEMEMRKEKKEDEEEENAAKVTDEQKRVEEKKGDEANSTDKGETDKEKGAGKGEKDDEEDEEEEEKAAIRWLLGDQSQTQSVDIAADPESLEM